LYSRLCGSHFEGGPLTSPRSLLRVKIFMFAALFPGFLNPLASLLASFLLSLLPFTSGQYAFRFPSGVFVCYPGYPSVQGGYRPQSKSFFFLPSALRKFLILALIFQSCPAVVNYALNSLVSSLWRSQRFVETHAESRSWLLHPLSFPLSSITAFLPVLFP